ncbi:2-hydroxyacid dehydrogenase [Acinetobacter sp. WZC-1]|uniref:2-hydroxyacid dehydrogenase n=1 Tax=Acinetobacter sp. WZC-1 TaxID=3459034 RepID=UPI00403D9EAC
MKAVYLDHASLDKNDLDLSALKRLFDELILYPVTEKTQLLQRVHDAEVIISNKVMLDAEIIRQCPALRLILISATGTNNIDLKQASAQGIVVCNCQGYGTASVAQHTLCLMLAMATSLMKYDQSVRQGQWSRSPTFCILDFPVIELAGKTLGIIGYGELGQAVAKLAEAFGMKVLIGRLEDRPEHPDRVPFADLLPRVDFLSLHCPLTTETRDLIGAAEFAVMKPSAFLINCARGGIVNEQALADALRQKQIAGAAMDVLIEEPPQPDHVLLADDIPNLVITPHSAWGSVDARQRIVDQMVENTVAFMQGQPIRQVNSTG